MSVTVSLQIFSGRPNPSWELTTVQVRELVARLKKVRATTLLKPPGIVGGLGYRGFLIVAAREPNLDPLIYVHAGIADLDRFGANLFLGSTNLEEWLLDSAGPGVNAVLKSHVQAALVAPPVGPSTLTAAPTVLAGPPPFNPGKWNNTPSILLNNNCYNYANDLITNTFAQPGKGSGQTFKQFICADVGVAAVADGQVASGKPTSTPKIGHYIALVIWPKRDHHWYRLDNSGMWSHKSGQTPATDRDQVGATITDPQTCDRGPYTDFCGYYLCDPAKVTVQ